MNYPDKYTIDNKNKIILEELDDFNQKYTRYIDCSNNKTATATATTATPTNCSIIDSSFNTVYMSYNKLVGDTGDMSGLVQMFENTPTIPQSVYDSSYQYLMDTYKNTVIPTRNELDEKMRQLDTNDSVYRDYKINHDLTVYTYVIWCVFATSIIYYTFMKMND